MLLKMLVVLTACTSIMGCGCSKPSKPKVPIDILLSAPEQLEIDGRKYVLETSLNRDFMPICPPDGKPLIALIWLTATDSLEFPASINADQLWIIRDQEVWETKFSNEVKPKEPYRKHQLEKIARDGPKWGPRLQVEVVVRISKRIKECICLELQNNGLDAPFEINPLTLWLRR
jgi:hypothetical protein